MEQCDFTSIFINGDAQRNIEVIQELKEHARVNKQDAEACFLVSNCCVENLQKLQVDDTCNKSVKAYNRKFEDILIGGGEGEYVCHMHILVTFDGKLFTLSDVGVY